MLVGFLLFVLIVIIAYVLMFEFYLDTDYVYYNEDGKCFTLIEKGLFTCQIADRWAYYRIPTYNLFFMSKSLL
jgi:hypothetical protein